MYYFSFNIPDWSLATAHLSLEEEAVYFRLVRYYYDTEQPIPLETQSVIRRLRLGSYESQVETVLAEFFARTEKGFVHARCEAELKEYRKTVKRNRENGAKGGRPSKSKASSASQKKPTGFPDGTDADACRNPNQEPITNNQEPVDEIHSESHSAYPRLNALKGIDFRKWPDLPSQDAMAQWLKVRNNKRATNTQIAMDAVMRETMMAAAYDVTAEECIRYATEQSWSGFKWSWIENELKASSQLSGSPDGVGASIARKYFAEIRAMDSGRASLLGKLADRSWADPEPDNSIPVETEVQP